MPSPDSSSTALYRGRFAPSPTGPLHFGSLVAALGSALEAKAHDGQWLLRIEDVDTPRTVPGASDSILRDLERHGFSWHGPVIYQSQRQDAYAAALAQLREQGAVFPCACSRKEIADSASGHSVDGAAIYPGACRNGLPSGRSARAWRLRVDTARIAFTDAVQGQQQQDLARDVGDFVLLRADGLFAYQLAVVVDDAWQGITDIVRGADLLDSTARQIWLQQRLGLPTPRYAHLPIATNAAGEKLSKQTLAPALDAAHAAANLHAALAFLGQRPPPELARFSVGEVWAWAEAHWSLAGVPHCRGIVA
jgi:glutamyl-Q tRNA(Asp) synthetase